MNLIRNMRSKITLLYAVRISLCFLWSGTGNFTILSMVNSLTLRKKHQRSSLEDCKSSMRKLISIQRVDCIPITKQSTPFQWRHMDLMAAQNTGNSTICSTLCSGTHNRKHQSSASHAFWGESTGHRWIPLTKGQSRGKCVHLMTSRKLHISWDILGVMCLGWS